MDLPSQLRLIPNLYVMYKLWKEITFCEEKVLVSVDAGTCRVGYKEECKCAS